MEVQTLRYYLKIFSIFLFLIIFSLFTHQIFFKNHNIYEDIIIIKKNNSINTIIINNFNELYIYEKLFLKIYYKFYAFFNKKIHYGEFKIDNKITFHNFLNKVTKPSNVIKKIAIIEGSSKYDLGNKLSEFFTNFDIINYNDILANTYYLNTNNNFEEFYLKLKKYKINFFNKNRENKLFSKFTDKQIMIIASLIEKEGLDYNDKKNIFSVINNRLERKMKLQIDATVLFSLTNGNYNLGRNLTFEDLKFKHNYNTYVINGLPPEPISYVGTKTIELMLENYNTDYLFYFFNENEKRHIFTKTFDEHKKKLNEYRKSK